MTSEMMTFRSGSITSEDMASANGDTGSSNEDQDQSIAKGGVTTPFPWKLHIMLDHMEATGDKSIVGWQPHGRAFTVYKPKEFVSLIMTQFFNQTKYASFQRQLNLYGFSRLTHGPDKGAYYHSCFIRGERHLCRKMIRQKIKGTKVRKSLSPEEEPNFYNMSGTLPTIPSDESIAEQRALQHASKGAAKVTPTPVKAVKRSPARRTSKVTSTRYPMIPQDSQPNANSYVMLPQPTQPLRATRTVSPNNSASNLYEKHQNYHNFEPVSQAAARGGDLLFFEGQPFRYLEHIEALPSSSSSMVNRPSDASGNSTLQNMITTIVNLDAQYQRPNDTAQNMCSV